VKYEDARAELASRCQQAYYNLGFERGHFAGMVDSSSPKQIGAPALRAFHRQISSAIAAAKLPRGKMVVALLDFTRAVARRAQLRIRSKPVKARGSGSPRELHNRRTAG
jgi:hypothetical protein